MSDQTSVTGRVEYGRQLDCRVEGCNPFHSDHGEVFPWPDHVFGVPDMTQPITVNGHAARWVTRTIPAWPTLESDEGQS